MLFYREESIKCHFLVTNTLNFIFASYYNLFRILTEHTELSINNNYYTLDTNRSKNERKESVAYG